MLQLILKKFRFLFFFLSEKLSNKTLSMFLSIIESKIFYYLVKFLLINSVFISGELISTPIYIQLVMLVVFSGYFYLIKFDRSK